MPQWIRRLHYFLNRSRFERELADEMAFHREMTARHGGARFGNVLRLREEARAVWGWTWIDHVSQDLRFASRLLWRSPAFTFAAILMLAVGIGVNVAGFGFFNTIVFRPLPVHDPETLLRFERSAPRSFADSVPYAAMAFYRAHSTTLAAVMALHSSRVVIQNDERPQTAHFVTANVFSELGAMPALGRALDPSRDDAVGTEPVTVLSYGLWQRDFGGDPSVVGRSITINDKPVTVVGVASPAFTGLNLDGPAVWLPMSSLPYIRSVPYLLTGFSPASPSVLMWGRLGAGQSARAAEQELTRLAAELRRSHPEEIWEGESLPSRPGGYPVSLTGMRSGMFPIVAVIGALGFLIVAAACANLGSLLLARGVARDREIGIRLSIGAGRGRLVRQLLTESLLLGALGSAAGLVTGYVLLRGMFAMTALPVWLDPTPDWRVAGFTTVCGVASVLMFGLTPALHAARRRLRASFSRQFLIGIQVAASCILLVVASLLVRALQHAVTADPGFAYQQVISIDPGLGGASVDTARAHLDQLRTRLLAHPGIEAVSIASNPPLGNRWTVMKKKVGDRLVDVHVNNVDAEFFETMSIPLIRGRAAVERDRQAIVVSDALARLAWPGDDPLGKSFENATVVGVAGNAHLVSPEDADAVELYQVAAPDVLPSVVMLVKTVAAPQDVLSFATATARAIDRTRFPDVHLMSEAFRDKLRASQYAAATVSLLGLGALMLASLGVIGLVAYSVTQRTKDIAIRVALGARPLTVIFDVLNQFSRPVVAGLVVGVGGAAALSQVLRRVLYGVSNLDPTAYVSALVVFAAIMALAALIPARRALRIEPMRALRYE